MQETDIRRQRVSIIAKLNIAKIPNKNRFLKRYRVDNIIVYGELVIVTFDVTGGYHQGQRISQLRQNLQLNSY